MKFRVIYTCSTHIAENKNKWINSGQNVNINFDCLPPFIRFLSWGQDEISWWFLSVQVESYTNHQPQPYPQQRWDRNDASSPHTDQTENLQWIEIRVNLQPFHFSNGQLNLRCSAQIPGIYSAISEVQLGAGLREPVPERGNTNFMLTLNEKFWIYNTRVHRHVDM